jgi:hypothetical protein
MQKKEGHILFHFLNRKRTVLPVKIKAVILKRVAAPVLVQGFHLTLHLGDWFAVCAQRIALKVVLEENCFQLFS